MPRGAAPGERRGGRAKGTKNKATIERQAEVSAILKSGITPMELLTRAMGGDTSITPLQMQAAVAAAPYIHPRLVAQTTTLQGPNGGPVETASKTVTITTTDPTEAAKAYAKFVSGT